MASIELLAENIKRAKTDLDNVRAKGYSEGYEQGKAESGNGLPYDMGEFVLDADVQLKIGINHNLGEVPEVVVVWTDDFADLTEENPSPYSTTTNLGFIWLRGLTGLSQRLTSAATSENGIIINGYLSNGEYRANFTNPMSVAYTPELPTTTQFYAPYTGNKYYWRAGVKYKYFVAKAWWNNGGAVNAE